MKKGKNLREILEGRWKWNAKRNFDDGQKAIEKRDFVKALFYLHNTTLVLEQSNELTLEFQEVYLMMSQCYMNLRKYDLAMRYVEHYEKFNNDNLMCQFCSMYKSGLVTEKNAQDKSEDELYKLTINTLLEELNANSRPSPILHFNVASLYCGVENYERTFHHLRQAFANGFNDWKGIYSESRFNTILNTREFVHIFLEYYKN